MIQIGKGMLEIKYFENSFNQLLIKKDSKKLNLNENYIWDSEQL